MAMENQPFIDDFPIPVLVSRGFPIANDKFLLAVAVFGKSEARLVFGHVAHLFP
jgi:hypothetical protein